MPTEEQIRELAYNIWQQEGQPDGKHEEHYFRARQILEERESSSLIGSTPSPTYELAPQPQTPELAPQPAPGMLPGQNKRRKHARH